MNNKTLWILILIIGIIVFYGVYRITGGLSLKTPSEQAIKDGIELVNLKTGWFISERALNKIKILPFVELAVKNSLNEPIAKGTLNFVVTFKVKGDKINFDTGWKIYPSKKIPIGKIGEKVRISCTHGYIGSSAEVFEKNKSKWKILEATIFVKYKGSKLIELKHLEIAQKIY